MSPSWNLDPTGAASRGAAVLALLLAACGGTRGPAIPLPDAGRAGCRLPGSGGPDAGGPAAPGDTLRIAAPGPLAGTSPPEPAGLAERIAYRHLYATLVEVDCRGRLRPGLAVRWTSRERGRRWSFRLARRDAGGRAGAGRGGDRPRATTVISAWRRSGLLSGAGPRDGTPDSLALYAARTAERRLSVSLPRPVRRPALFAAPRFAVTGLVSTQGLPAATGPYRLRSVDRGDRPTWWLLPRNAAAPVLGITVHRGGRPGPGPSARDLLDRGVDLLITRRPAPRRYAASLPGYRALPLPWLRTYVLLVPRRAAGPGAGPPGDADPPRGRDAGVGAGPTDRTLRDLARDAVRAEARPSKEPHWWRARCGFRRAGSTGPAAERGGAAAPPSRPARLVYPETDATAEDVATRLAALSGRSDPPSPDGVLASALTAARGPAGRLRAAGLSPARFEDVLREGGAAAYVVALPRRTLAPCRDRARLRARVPWLDGTGRGILPLVDTRPHLVLRDGVAGVRLDWDGTPRLENAVAGARARSP